MDLPKIDIMAMPDLPAATSIFAVQPGTESMSDDTMSVLMAYIYEMTL
jgi:hypothetical protein